MEGKQTNIAEEEAMNKLVKEILKNGDVKTVFDVESKLKQSFGKVIQTMLEASKINVFGAFNNFRNKYEIFSYSVLTIFFRNYKMIS